MIKSSVSLNLLPLFKEKKPLSISAMEPSTSEKKQSDSEGYFRRSKRFRSKVLNFWDFERIAVVDTEEGAKTAIIKDVPGEGTIVLQDQDSVCEETCSSVFLKKNCHGETMNSETKPEPESVNKSVATKVSRNKTPVPNMLLSSKKSHARPNGGKVNDKTNSKNVTVLKRSRSSKPANDSPMLATGTIGSHTRKKKSHKSNDQVRTGTNSEGTESEEVEVRGWKQRCSSPVAAAGNYRKTMGDKRSSGESSKRLRSRARSKTRLKPLPMISETIDVKSEVPISKSTSEASIENTPRDGRQGTSSVQQGAQAAPSNSDARATSAVGAQVHNGGTFITGENLVFHGSSNSFNSAAAATGEFALAKGGSHGDVETYFLHLRKGYIAFVAPRNTKLFVVRGYGHCSLVGGGTPTLVNVLFRCAEVDTEKGSTLLVSVDDNCPELIVCLMLYDSASVTPH